MAFRSLAAAIGSGRTSPTARGVGCDCCWPLGRPVPVRIASTPGRVTIGKLIAIKRAVLLSSVSSVHHKFSDTDGDIHNTKRGFFFTHCGEKFFLNQSSNLLIAHRIKIRLADAQKASGSNWTLQGSGLFGSSKRPSREISARLLLAAVPYFRIGTSHIGSLFSVERESVLLILVRLHYSLRRLFTR